MCCYLVRSYGLQHRVLQRDPDVSEEYIISFFRVEKSQARNQRKQAVMYAFNMQHAPVSFLLGSISILNMEAIHSSETLGCENVKSNVLLFVMLFMQFLKGTLLVQSPIFYFAAGFLPTFGPAFINLYGTVDTRKPCLALHRRIPRVRSLKYGEAYMGRLLLAVKTETLDSCATSSQLMPAKRRFIRHSAPAVSEVSKRVINGVWYFIP
jgi:hypothetical protein